MRNFHVFQLSADQAVSGSVAKRASSQRHPMTYALMALFLCLFSVVAVADAPNIGLIYTASGVRALEEEERDTRQSYRDAIEEQGGRIVVLGQTHPPALIVERLDTLDGLLLPGGIDVDPVFYGEPPDEHLGEVDTALDHFEFRVLDHARRNRLPVLGICRGHQVMNVYYGGSLIQDIPTQHTGEVTVKHRYTPLLHPDAVHSITIEPDTILHSLLETERIVVNTIHHQAVKRLADGFIITARTDDGIVEAMESTGDVFLLGVQFHPERMVSDDPRMKAIFARFVEEARKKR